MRPGLWTVTVIALAALTAGCAPIRVPGAEVTEHGTYVFRGTGTSPVAKTGDDLSILEARIAADVMARADLLQSIQGATVEGEVTVDDLMFEGQSASSIVEGTLSRVLVTYEDEESIAEATSVTAIAELELTRKQLRKLDRYAQ